MEDVANAEEKLSKMGASNNNNAVRIAILKERKRQIEESLATRNQELKQLCIQEAELTGITPPEMPLEPGETLPSIRRRIGTAYQLPESLIKNTNSKDELIADLELQIQLHANMAEAALGLANEQNMSKTMKRQHRAEYQKHKNQCMALQEKLALLKEKANSEHKQKKKPRASDFMEDTVSLGTNVNEPFTKSEVRHSMRSAKHSTSSNHSGSNCDQRYDPSTRSLYRNSDMPYAPPRPEDLLASGVYRLSLNGYYSYMEKRESTNMYLPQSSNHYQYNTSQTSLSPHNPYISQHNPLMSQHLQQHSPHSTQHSPYFSNMMQHSPGMQQHSPHNLTVPRTSQHMYGYHQYTEYSRLSHSPHMSTTQLHRQSSPPKVQSQYYPSQVMHTYRHLQNDGYRNPHQIQPHQQYEQMNATSGLGGCWKKIDNGELVWCNSNTIDINWQRDKRFGSLDRRKNKKISKRVSPNIDNKSATLATLPNYQDQIRNASVKASQMVSRRSQDNGQLVRTQSLGSVGAQTVDSILYPSDDNSSCGSDNRISQNLRKQKEKEWLETSLDGSVSPTQSVHSSSQPMIPNVLAPEEKYISSPSQPIRPVTPKPPLEIPAESNPSPRMKETNIEFFNNNIPKNCTIVQAGHVKPYHEETKPFEMSDFYKYSTKFKRSPSKAENECLNRTNQNVSTGASSRSLNEKFEDSSTSQCSPKLQQYSNSTSLSSSMDNSGSLNISLELGQIAVSDKFSAEMNAWYKDQQQNNNTPGNPIKNKSTATLV